MIQQASFSRTSSAEPAPVPISPPHRKFLPPSPSAALILLSAFLIGAALRLFNFTPIGWIPDTYDRISATQTFLGHFSAPSKLYPPGPVFLLAPFFALLPDSLQTVEIVVSLSGILTILAAFILGLDLARHKGIALLYAALIALTPDFVYSSRSTAFDNIAVFLALAILVITPRLRQSKSVFMYTIYGILLAVLVDFRFTYAALLPGFFIYWLQPFENRVRWGQVVAAILSLPVAVSAAAFVVCMTIFALLAGSLFPGSATGAISLERFLPNFIDYWAQMLYAPIGVPLLVPFALVGFARLRRMHPSGFYFILYVLATWPVIFSQFTFYSYRYMLLPALLLAILVAIGISYLWTIKESFTGHLPLRIFARSTSILLGIFLTSISIAMAINWPSLATESDEGLLIELRPIVSSLGEESLVVSAVSRGFYDSPGAPQSVDLIDLWLDWGSGLPAQTILKSRVQQALDNQQPVYYLYSRYEAGKDFHGHGRSHFQNFFDSVSTSFLVEEVYRTQRKNLDSVNWILYSVRLKAP